MKKIFFLLFTFAATSLMAQHSSEVVISFAPRYKQLPVYLVEDFELDSLQIESFKFYISQIELYDGTEKIFAEEQSYHLIDAADKASLNIRLQLPMQGSFSQIKFKIGIDSLTNISGALGGDLDPTKGMYWTWQSGYINFKLEGRAQNCPARHHAFQFHIGGYQYPFNSLQTVSLATTNEKAIEIKVAIDELLAKIDLAKDYQVMRPNKKSMQLAQWLPSIFSIAK